jgi:hypothetical protein
VSAGRGVLFVLAGQAFFFWHQKTSVASLNAVENIKPLKKQKCRLKIYSLVIMFLSAFMRAAPFCIEVSA